MVEGGSILHADHPRKWIIFARRFTVHWERYLGAANTTTKHRLRAEAIHSI